MGREVAIVGLMASAWGQMWYFYGWIGHSAVVFICGMYLVLKEEGDYRILNIATCGFVLSVVAALVGLIWPVGWAFLLAAVARYSCFFLLGKGGVFARLIWAGSRRLVECIRERARRTCTSPVRRLPINEPWRRRGWLVMMRARRQGSLARPEGWLAMLRRRARRPRLKQMSASIGPKKPKAEGVGQESSQLELQELGRHPTSFIWAVESAVKIEEEGLFRHVVMYL